MSNMRTATGFLLCPSIADPMMRKWDCAVVRPTLGFPDPLFCEVKVIAARRVKQLTYAERSNSHHPVGKQSPLAQKNGSCGILIPTRPIRKSLKLDSVPASSAKCA